MKKMTITMLLVGILLSSMVTSTAKTIDYYGKDGSHTRVEYQTDKHGNTTVRSYDVPKDSAGWVLLKLIGAGLLYVIVESTSNN